MTRRVLLFGRALVVAAVLGWFVAQLGPAVDAELATGSVLSERGSAGTRSTERSVLGAAARSSGGVPRSESAPPPVTKRISSTSSVAQGKGAEWWARRAIQNGETMRLRGRTIRRLQRVARERFVPWYWLRIGSCESGLRWDYNGSSGFDGAVQFHPGTWSANRLRGYPAFAHQASPFQQLVVAEIVLSRQGWRAWPECSRKVGLR